MANPLTAAQRYFDAWNRHDAAGILDTFASGGTYTDPLASALTGESICAYANQLWDAFPDLHFEIVGTPLSGDGLVAIQWLMKGINTGPFHGLPPSNRLVSLPGADFIVIDGDSISSVTGYFDAGEVPRQLGLKTLVQPETLGPFQYGTVVAVQSGKTNQPGAFSITAIHTRSEHEKEKITDYSRKIAQELLKMPGFIGWTGINVGERMITVTAWDTPEASRRLNHEGTHVEAMKAFFGTGLTKGGHTSIWSLDRFNSIWIRCTHCGNMMSYEKSGGQCTCGEALSKPPPYW